MKKFICLILLIFPFIASAESNYLYDVLKNEAESGGLAKEYTGEHHDSFTEEPTHKIYHWYSSSIDGNTSILNKSNVIFGGFCWQMIRTTDTGGVKLLYNGISVNNQCLNDRPNVAMPSRLSYYYSDYDFLYAPGYEYDPVTNNLKLKGTINKNLYSTTGKMNDDLEGMYRCNMGSEVDHCGGIIQLREKKDDRSFWGYYVDTNIPFNSIGSMQYNYKYDSPIGALGVKLNPATYIGYKYGDVINTKYESYMYSKSLYTESSYISNNRKYVFGNSVKKNSDGTYSLQNRTTIYGSSLLGDNNYVGKYTCGDNKTECVRPYYVYKINNSYIYYIYHDEKRALGKSRDGNTLVDYIVIDAKELLDNVDNYKEYHYTCGNDSITCDDGQMQHIIGDLSLSYKCIQDKIAFQYGESASWDGEKYILNNTILYEDRNQLLSHRYFCLDYTKTTCKTVGYILGFDYTNTFDYIELNNGVMTPEELLPSIFEKNNKDSTVKIFVDEFYKNNLLEYQDNLEDTIFCNDRSVSKSGWNDVTSDNPNIVFKASDLTTNLICENETDQFSISNNKAKLNYPIALLTAPELKLLNSFGNYNGLGRFTLMTPETQFHMYEARENSHSFDQTFFIGSSFVDSESRIRPVVSLKPYSKYDEGNGTKDNPYIANGYDIYGTINVEVVNETENIKINVNDLTEVQYEEKVSFKVTPIKGYKVNSIRIVDGDNNEIEYTSNVNEYSFIMPASNVTIIPSYERVSNSINIEDDKNTKEIVIEVNDAKAVVYEETVRFTITPKEEYELIDINIKDKVNNIINYKKTAKENEYEFIMPDTDVTIKPIYKLIYKFIEGMGQEYDITKDTKLRFKSNMEYDLFKGNGKIYIDNEIVDSKNYELKKGSTIVIFNEEYTKKLGIGDHTITMKLNGEEIKTNFNVLKQEEKTNEENTKNEHIINPQTKDKILLVIGVILTVSLLLYLIEKEKNKINKYNY